MKATHFVLVAFIVLTGPATAWAANGQDVFETHCASCHGIDGRAKTPAGKKLRVKDLTQSKSTDAEIEQKIVSGTQDAKGNQRMPEFKSKLSPEEIAALVEYVKKLRG